VAARRRDEPAAQPPALAPACRRALLRLDPRAREEDFSDEAIGRLGDERRMREVLAVFERLPVQEQEVLALSAWAGLGYDDCALALGVPVGTVRSRLSRARSHLRELVADEPVLEPAVGACG
jgi:RNA polymerase sigma-70 factor (ECF subfamily)